MRGRVRSVWAGEREAGLTLIELLVASAMSVIVVGAATAMLISVVRQQPQISERSQDVSTTRFVLERMTREIRNGISVVPEASSASNLTFYAYVRHANCGSSAALPPGESARVCKVTYSCGATACTRAETTSTDPGAGTPVPLFSGIDNANVFNYDPDLEEASFVGITFRVPDPRGEAHLTISDGATLRGGNPFG
jgi:hypothetical protein